MKTSIKLGICGMLTATALSVLTAPSVVGAPDPLDWDHVRRSIYQADKDCSHFYLRTQKSGHPSNSEFSPSDTLLVGIVENTCLDRLDRQGQLVMRVDGQVVGSAPMDELDVAGLAVELPQPLTSLSNVTLDLEGTQTDRLAHPDRVTPPEAFTSSWTVDLK